jgi:hypothetical protein
MPEGAACCANGGKFGRPHEVGGLAGMGCGAFRPKKTPIREAAMEKYIHRENLTLFKKRLAESHSEAEREVLLKLLADEKAKEPTPKNGIPKSG